MSLLGASTPGAVAMVISTPGWAHSGGYRAVPLGRAGPALPLLLPHNLLLILLEEVPAPPPPHHRPPRLTLTVPHPRHPHPLAVLRSMRMIRARRRVRSALQRHARLTRRALLSLPLGHASITMVYVGLVILVIMHTCVRCRRACLCCRGACRSAGQVHEEGHCARDVGMPYSHPHGRPP